MPEPCPDWSRHAVSHEATNRVVCVRARGYVCASRPVSGTAWLEEGQGLVEVRTRDGHAARGPTIFTNMARGVGAAYDSEVGGLSCHLSTRTRRPVVALSTRAVGPNLSPRAVGPEERREERGDGSEGRRRGLATHAPSDQRRKGRGRLAVGRNGEREGVVGVAAIGRRGSAGVGAARARPSLDAPRRGLGGPAVAVAPDTPRVAALTGEARRSRREEGAPREQTTQEGGETPRAQTTQPAVHHRATTGGGGGGRDLF
jgi:hypothetical protein